MSNYIEQALPRPSDALVGAWHGIVAEDATSTSSRVPVLIPALAPDIQLGPARWHAPGDTLPNRGDHCLVIFDNEQEPWLIVWPYEA